MKNLIPATLGILTVAILSPSCLKSDAAKSPEATPENGAQFRKGEGLSLTDEMKKAIGFQIAAVGEEPIASNITLELTATTAHEARGPVTSQQATVIKAGMEAQLTDSNGTVQSVEKLPFGMPGDLEVTVSTTHALTPGASLTATIALPASAAVPAVPASALLKTAEGSFVYTVNGKFYVRTPVKTGAANDQLVEITDGLYSGDEIVTTPVMSLWLAELQVLRGGKACTCGH